MKFVYTVPGMRNIRIERRKQKKYIYREKQNKEETRIKGRVGKDWKETRIEKLDRKNNEV